MRHPCAFPFSLHCGTALAFVALAHAASAAETSPEPLQAELVAEHAALVPGRSLSLGVRLRHAPHWHSYWINPGDSGLPTKLAWSLPSGYAAGDVAWPVPKRFDVGGLYNIGYDGDVLLPVALTVPSDGTVGSNAHVALTVKWLVCREECLPGKATLALDLPVARELPRPDARWTAAFTRARLAQPQASAWSGGVHDDGARIVVRLAGAGLPPASVALDAFVVQRKVVDNRPPAIRRDGDALVIEAARSEYFTQAPPQIDLVVTTTDGVATRGWHVRVPYAAAGTAHAN
ncbi:thiol:disulfide interchange protein DsbD [Dokdonella fugitiva]|uniref:Thiol:disulfide interchange protein DsbD n=1 Tax=Dokdonella fugitiva TaxID=328517 RepID=A0A839F4W7_9GAMM|nr:protein-disulfide reductase DsbD domain-containing protein [Dokdonella fugitiva]MBA8887241.1 thiol:disulfide interchange protein DsbD [Dokdonella fugitiva]